MYKGSSNDKEIYEQIAEWLNIYHSTDSEKEKAKMRELIVEPMAPVVKNIARKIARRSTDPVEDLIQAGYVGLLKAINYYSKEKNDNFRVYAGYLIIGEIKHYIRDKSSTIRVPGHIQELAIRINNFTRDLSLEEINELTSHDVAEALDVSPKAVDFAMEVDRRSSTVSLDAVFQVNNDSLSYEEVLPADNYIEKQELQDAKIIFKDVINKLSPEDKVIIDMYYSQDMTQKEIAQSMMLSQMSVTRKLRAAFGHMADLVNEKASVMENTGVDIRDKDSK